ncbi:AraC family transcriptional regulator [Sporolactobacillus pectinivorans]|uniref:AraC family transcriptional regulator n=1 Tax=Sporolactobacillus pectinivorans TaxID=1591408 RepID=UPI000C264867|nr:AraC family transcriptional regulator [Sporolactobacillus pectinivorans]
MNANNLFFHIHYCKCRKLDESERYSRKITRTIQHHELILFTGGKGYITIEKKSYPIKGGRLFYICPDVPHSIELNVIESDSEKPLYFLSVHFSYARVRLNNSQWEIKNEAKRLLAHFTWELKDYYSIEELFKALVDRWDAKQPGYEFTTQTLLQQLLIATAQNIEKHNRNYSISLKMERIINYMHQRINNKVTLTELSDLVQLSPAYLSRTFKDTTGCSVIGYFNKIKIDKAKELIIERNKKIKEVAQVLGFADEFYFSRLFKKMEGISPSEFYSKNVHGL